MFNDSNSIENHSGNSEINDISAKSLQNSISPVKAVHVNQEIVANESPRKIEVQNELSLQNGFESSPEYLVKYQMKAFRAKNTTIGLKNNRKRSWRAASKIECPSFLPKKRGRKHEKIRQNRRSSIRLKGQASPLYFPIFRLKTKDTPPNPYASSDSETSVKNLPEIVSMKKKRGRPKRILSIEKPLENLSIVETLPNDQEIPSNDEPNSENECFVKVKKSKILKPKLITKKRRIPERKSSVVLQTPNSPDPVEIKKKRPWNIPRNKLPSFTIVNNPLTFKTSEFYNSKPPTGVKHIHSNVNVPLYACRICGKHFARKLSVRGHMKSHSKQFEYKIRAPQKSTLILPSPENPTDPLIESIKTAVPLRKHRKSRVPKTGYTCNICGRVFYHKMGIRGHKKSHSLIVGTKRGGELALSDEKLPERSSNSFTLGHPLNTRSKAGIFDDILFSNDKPATEYPIWKKEVRIGDEYQVTEFPTPDSLVTDELHEDLIWSAQYTAPKVEQYLKLSDSPIVKFGGRNQEYALHILLRCQGNIWDALNVLIDGKNIIPEDDPVIGYNFSGLSFWTEDETQDFKTAWIKYGKDFTQIQKYVISKSLPQVIEFYYRWTIECPDEYRKYSRTISSRKYLQTLTSPITEPQILQNLNEAINTELTDETFKENSPNEIELKCNEIKTEKEVVTLLKRNLPSPMGTPTRPAKSLKELVSSYQDRKEIKTQSSNFRSRSASPKKKNLENTKVRKYERFQHKRIWTKKHTVSLKRGGRKSAVSKNLIQGKTAGIQGIPILKSVANSNHKRIINRMGTFPCRKCKRVFDRIKSLNAHMKCHSIRVNRGFIHKEQINTES
ncbi:Transcriptional-regulating factor 1 isoform X4 [Oopsacas minuta]|uniref:Transcriptional-regulating factor 1 isoform X4 n=1 Tax=Oopsacas minuta TaxID=111878 RepID=A0AAV7K7V5_9METZ|nr:Transcriptional-regulating factor 1 isoform X4 [Oopsacas minuta]